MKSVLAVSVLLILSLSGPASAQSRIDGTWRVEGTGTGLPWEVFLARRGASVIGLVNHCANNESEIFNATVDGDTVTFQCKRPDGVSTITFHGRLNGDEMSVRWTNEEREGGGAPGPQNKMFGPAAPDHFIAKRVPDGALAADAVGRRGSVYYAAVGAPASNVQVAGTLYVPETVKRIQAIVFVDTFGAGSVLQYGDADWERFAARTSTCLVFAQFSDIGPSIIHGAEAASVGDRSRIVPLLLSQFAQQTGQTELANAPLVWWAHSAAVGVEQYFASLYSSRMIGLVFYQGGCSDSANGELRPMPALCVAGGRDTNVPPAQVEAQWRAGRAAGWPLTFAVDPEAEHAVAQGGRLGVNRATPLMLAWMTAVIGLRVDPTTGTLRMITSESAAIRSGATLSGSNEEANWLPDAATAQAWRSLTAPAK